MQVSWECQNQMFRNEKETGDDIRLSTRLFNKCLSSYQKFCKDVEPGAMRVQECLEDNMDESGFNPECKGELEGMIAKRVSDFRMDNAMRDACESELKDTCGATLEEMDADEKVRQSRRGWATGCAALAARRGPCAGAQVLESVACAHGLRVMRLCVSAASAHLCMGHGPWGA